MLWTATGISPATRRRRTTCSRPLRGGVSLSYTNRLLSGRAARCFIRLQREVLWGAFGLNDAPLLLLPRCGSDAGLAQIPARCLLRVLPGPPTCRPFAVAVVRAWARM